MSPTLGRTKGLSYSIGSTTQSVLRYDDGKNIERHRVLYESRPFAAWCQRYPPDAEELPMSALALSILLSLVSAVAYAGGAIVQERVAVSSPTRSTHRCAARAGGRRSR